METAERKTAELLRKLQAALPEILEAVAEERPVLPVLLANGLRPQVKRDLLELGYLTNVSGRTGRAARFTWSGPTEPRLLSERLLTDLGLRERQRWTVHGSSRYVRATVAHRCVRCRHHIEAGSLYLLAVGRRGERRVCLPCRKPGDEPAHEQALEALRYRLENLRTLQPEELTTWRLRLDQTAELLEAHLNVSRYGPSRDLHQHLRELAKWLHGVERIVRRHLEALRYRSQTAPLLCEQLTWSGQVPTRPIVERPDLPADQRAQLIDAEELERGYPYQATVVTEGLQTAVRWLRDLHDRLASRRRYLQPTDHQPTETC